MTKFYNVIYTITQTETTSVTMEGDSAEAIVDTLRNRLGGSVDNLVIHEVRELEPIAAQANGKPSLKLVN